MLDLLAELVDHDFQLDAGKSTIARTLLGTDRQIGLSVSVTTRQRRPSEVEAVHYHLKSVREFERLRDSDALLEWAEVHG
ncbi:hypothetical protein ACC719_35915, partial [Rhizobium ruizarguesonis]